MFIIISKCLISRRFLFLNIGTLFEETKSNNIEKYVVVIVVWSKVLEKHDNRLKMSFSDDSFGLTSF